MLMRYTSCLRNSSSISVGASDKFFLGCIFAKIPPLWRNFAIFLKHQRHEFSVQHLNGPLDVEENMRAKENHINTAEGDSSANIVQKSVHKFKENNKVPQTTNFKKEQNKEKKDPFWVCSKGQPLGQSLATNTKGIRAKIQSLHT
jgi:hypothetical protein